jgi:hypothetical protein
MAALYCEDTQILCYSNHAETEYLHFCHPPTHIIQ